MAFEGEGENDDAGAGGGIEGGTEGGTGGDASGGADGGKSGGGDEPAPWYGTLSTERSDDKTLADAEWMKNKGYADPAAMVKAMRSLETRLGSDKRIEIPGEDATDEQRAAFRAAIGVPESADGYTFDVPKGWEADMALIGKLREVAFASNTPLSSWQAQTAALRDVIMDQHNQQVAAHDAEKDAVEKEWGAQADQNTELYKRGMEAFGFDVDRLEALQIAMGEGGTRFLMELGLKLGRLSGEDGFIEGGRKSFGIPVEQARAELERLEKDRDFIAKLKARDKDAKARHERLVAIISADDERKQRQAAA